uniref:Uncharacterized protein n=1 Tax=Knipowitschia caucasica TaxID=637954 RepID=A0AAV2J1H4_KNICA
MGAEKGEMDSLDHGPKATRALGRPVWAVYTLAAVLIFTTVVDVLGNLLVIVAVLRNRKLRNAAHLHRPTPPQTHTSTDPHLHRPTPPQTRTFTDLHLHRPTPITPDANKVFLFSDLSWCLATQQDSVLTVFQPSRGLGGLCTWINGTWPT